jgi:hypothetical protein
MPLNEPPQRRWDIPLGPVGLAAIAIVGAVAFTLGMFAFYGFQFLAYWPRIAGWSAGVAVFAAASGTLIECLVWNESLGRGLRFPASWRSPRGAMLAAGIFVVLAGAYWSAHQQYQCLLLKASVLFLIVFAVTVPLQEPILVALRKAQRPGAGLAALLVLEAGLMFATGEWMAIGEYDKGLKRFQRENQARWTLSATDRTEFYVDYPRQEVVLHSFAGEPIEIRRSLAGSVCGS